MDTNPINPDALKTRTDDLRRQAQELTPRELLLAHALEELETGLEELRVADEELRVQNEALEEMRDALEHQVQRYRDLFDQAPEAYLVTDADGLIQEANRAAETLLNVGARSLVGRPLRRFVALADRARFRDQILQDMPGEAAVERFLRLHTRRGEFPVTLAVSAARDKKGRTGALRWLIRDATAAGQAEEERYRLVVHELKDYAVFLMDEEGRILTWNAGAEQTFGYTAEEAIGRQAAILYTPKDRAQEAEARERDTARATGRAEDERWHLKADDSTFWGSGILTRLGDNGGRARFVKVVRDMTARKQAEDQMQSDFVREHRIARPLQNALLPQFPEDAFSGFAVTAFYEPAWEEAAVGGDFYDIVPLHDGRIAFVVGDVVGKGLNAAARTGEIKAGLRAFLREDPDPASALTRLNALVCDADQLDSVTDHLLSAAAVAVVDARTGEARFAVAGLEAPLVAHPSGEIESVPARGLTLGVSRDAAYQILERHLDVGDLLVLATDGLTEARRDGEFLGEDGLQAVLQKALPLRSPRAIGEKVLSEVRQFSSGTPTQSALRDDACLLLACRLPSSATSHETPEASQ